MLGLTDCVDHCRYWARVQGRTLAVRPGSHGYWPHDPADAPANRIVCWVFPDGTVDW